MGSRRIIENPVALYVFRSNKTKEIITATFDEKAVEVLKKLYGSSAAMEQHEARSKTTLGMYGKLFGLSGLQKKGTAARFAGMTPEQIKKQLAPAHRARRMFNSMPKRKSVIKKAEKPAKKKK